jgi:hypothetical protein
MKEIAFITISSLHSWLRGNTHSAFTVLYEISPKVHSLPGNFINFTMGPQIIYHQLADSISAKIVPFGMAVSIPTRQIFIRVFEVR